jgi:hypothetical protein
MTEVEPLKVLIVTNLFPPITSAVTTYVARLLKPIQLAASERG